MSDSASIEFANEAGDLPIGDVRDTYHRFRILIVGKSNAGKTTILRKVCEGDEEPLIHDQDGNKVDARELGDAGPMRGNHNINNEITYSSNPGFVFHDSGGFEQGSEIELEAVKNFIQKRQMESDLKDQLHLTWYCIPTGQARTALSSAEKSFLDKQAGDHPTVVLFTKWDGQIDASFYFLRRQMDWKVASAKAREHAESVYQERYLPLLPNIQVSPDAVEPADSVRLEAMHLPEARCDELLEKSVHATETRYAAAADMFAATQTISPVLTMKRAVRRVLTQHWSDIESTLGSKRGPKSNILKSLFTRHVPEKQFSATQSSELLSTIVADVLGWFPLLQRQILLDVIVDLTNHDESLVFRTLHCVTAAAAIGIVYSTRNARSYAGSQPKGLRRVVEDFISNDDFIRKQLAGILGADASRILRLGGSVESILGTVSDMCMIVLDRAQ